MVRDHFHVVSRWKVLGSPTTTTTLTVVEISCRNGTFSEKANVIIDAAGHARDLPKSELLVDYPIEPGTSAAVFRRDFCR